MSQVNRSEFRERGRWSGAALDSLKQSEILIGQRSLYHDHSSECTCTYSHNNAQNYNVNMLAMVVILFFRVRKRMITRTTMIMNSDMILAVIVPSKA